MEVTSELQNSIRTAIIETLDESYQEENIDELLANAVVDVLTAHTPKGKQAKLLPVQYIGHRESYSPSIAETGVWVKDETKMVPEEIARVLLAHPTVFIPGEAEEAEEVIAPPETEDQEEEEAKLTETRDMVNAFTRKDQVKEFVASQDSWPQIPKDVTKLADMKELAIRNIDMYGVL